MSSWRERWQTPSTRTSATLPKANPQDITTMTRVELRKLVNAWRDGHTWEERQVNRATAEQAFRELHIRYRVDSRGQWTHGDREALHPVDPGIAPWDVPQPSRIRQWERPKTSTCYPKAYD